MGWRPSALRIYERLLLLYPAEFRHEYGGQMEQLFDLRRRREAGFGFWVAVLWDIACSAPKEHLQILISDLRHAMRVLRKSPGFAAAALLALTLGIGATTTVFSLFNAVLLRSLPYGNPEQLVYLWTPLPTVKQLPRELAPTWADVIDWSRTNSSFGAITALQLHTAVLQNGNTRRVQTGRILGSFFATLQAAPEFGRVIGPADDRAGQPLVAVISDALWNSEFGRDPAVLETTLRLDGRQYRIVGVMPPAFGYPHGTDLPIGSPAIQRTDVWIPATLNKLQQTDRIAMSDEPDVAIGRLKPNITLSGAQAEMTAIEKRLAPLYAEEWRSVTSLLTPFLETALGPVRPLMRLTMAAVVLVLLIACANFASLLLVQGAERVHEMSVRNALGAGRERLVRQLFTGSMLLSLTGGILGVLASFGAVTLIARWNPGDIPRFEEAAVDGPVLTFGFLVSVVAGVLAGLYPAIRGSRADVAEILGRGGRGVAGTTSRIRTTLIVAEIAVAVVLLAASGLVLRSYLAVQAEDKGFSAATWTMTLNRSTEPDPPPIEAAAVAAFQKRLADFHRAFVSAVSALPQIAIAGMVDDLPLTHSEDIDLFVVDGQPSHVMQSASVRQATPGYLEAMQIRLLAGRRLQESDVPEPGADPSAVVVSQSFARLYFSEQTAIGRRLRFGKGRWSAIVGIVADVRHSSLEEAPQPTIYRPSWLGGTLVVRAAGPAVLAAIRARATALDPASTITEVRTMGGYIDDASARRRFQSSMMTALSGMALLLALIGLYGLLSYGVRQRSAELAIRVAVGATRGHILGLVLRYAITLTGTGLAIGLLLAVASTRALASHLYGVSPTDSITFVAVPALLLTVAVLACVAPALRATRINPVDALRAQ